MTIARSREELSPQVVIGTLNDPSAVMAKPFGVEDYRKTIALYIGEWDHRAMWSYLRLQYGKAKADALIKTHFDVLQTMNDKPLTKEQKMREMKLLFNDMVAAQKDPRKLQFIFEEDKVVAVASLKHLLIPPREVYGLVEQIIEQRFPNYQSIGVRELSGMTYEVKHVHGITFGVQIFGGNITTRKAISVSSWMRVQACFNPLSWLGLGNFKSFGIGNGRFERVLRIKVRSDLKPRLEAALQNSTSQVSSLDQRIIEAKAVPLKKTEAAIIASAFGLSWSVGERVIQQVLKRYAQEAQSLWGLSMALSYVSAHGKFRKVPEGSRSDIAQNLSTMAGATMLMRDKNYTKQQCVDWLQSHIKEGQLESVQRILKKLETTAK